MHDAENRDGHKVLNREQGPGAAGRPSIIRAKGPQRLGAGVRWARDASSREQSRGRVTGRQPGRREPGAGMQHADPQVTRARSGRTAGPARQGPPKAHLILHQELPVRVTNRVAVAAVGVGDGRVIVHAQQAAARGVECLRAGVGRVGGTGVERRGQCRPEAGHMRGHSGRHVARHAQRVA
jgi:hypothetical protein